MMDLEGLTYSAASSSEALDAVKLASKVGDYFPEVIVQWFPILDY